MNKIIFLIPCLFFIVETGVSQNIGINIPNPGGKLHIKGSADVSQLIIDGHPTQSNTSPLLRLRYGSGKDLLWIHADDSSNVFFGLYAGRANSINSGGAYNTFLGSKAGLSNVGGSFNTASGSGALFSNTSGANNTAIGSVNLFSNTTGINNTASGSYSLSSNTTGNNNTTNGYGSLFSNVSGSNNAAYGYSALFNNSSGDFNTAIGNETLPSITTGSKNTALGYGADVSAGDITNATAIGSNAYAGASNSVVLGSVIGVNGATANANVGIGTTSPHSSAVLEVKSTDKGILVPRIALTALNNASPVISPADALLVYNTASAGSGANAVSPGFYHWNMAANKWNSLNQNSTNGGAGFGSWGDCSTNSVSEYNPVADDAGQFGDRFGSSVSISGNFAIIGAQQDNEISGSEGSASIYMFDGNNWTFMQKLTDSPVEPSAYYGISVSISGDYAIVGAIYDGPLNEGSASIYQYNGTSWVFKQKLKDANPLLQQYFGVSVAVSEDYAVVGAYGDNVGGGPQQGSVSVYQHNGTSWMFMQKITDATGAAGDFFGGSVSISDDVIIVGAASDDVGSNANQGSVSIYKFNGSSWVLMQKITDSTGETLDNFGSSVSIDGNYALIGIERDDVVGNIDQGSASFYKYNGSSWELIKKLNESSGMAEDFFGCRVSISGDLAIIGSFGSDINANVQQGAAHVYLRVGLGWQKIQKLIDPGGGAYEFFGASTAIDAATKRFLIGATSGAFGAGKAVFGKVN